MNLPRARAAIIAVLAVALLGSAGPSRPGYDIHAAVAAPARTLVWSIGDPWELASREDGRGADLPMFSRTPAACTPAPAQQQCIGGTGAVSFHLQRPSLGIASEYRNMMLLQTWNADRSYAPDYALRADAMYDVQFQTVNRMKDDVQYVASLLWQNHPGSGPVITGFGMDDPDGRGNQFFFNYGGHGGGRADPYPWHGATRQGDVDTWEIQFRNSTDAGGWIDFYRNGSRQFTYSGRVVPTYMNDFMSFGLYYYDWANPSGPRSRLLSTDITFTYFRLYTIAARGRFTTP